MQLNTLSPASGSKTSKKRLGRGIGSGFGKTSGRGHKGQKARSGGGIRPGFEGGQMPLKQRLPKFGFTSRKQLTSQEVRLFELNKISGDTVTLNSLKEAGLIKETTKTVKIMNSANRTTGETITRALTVSGIRVSKGAQAAIEAAGGKVEIL